ncbi:MAG: HPP family protein [Methanomassiliicoccaceae archaeon]|jgi:CBS domain-containing protein|nr:CBS domain-containing protein [Euryarchaeota archaeon]HOB38020.1 CBS domain-containing protein [Methanomassiliicoccaceae archaeon]HQA20804.1 CBS domain-containing protein [Methanomassiliicoccaceae archaeon]HQD87889.1 CBS domain-containing protein [Methanomassiliicoccaceae archaeon]
MTPNELTGIQKREQICSQIEAVNLRDIMSKDFQYVGPDEHLTDVLKKMGNLDLHEIPVSQDGKRLMGVVSYGTLLKRRNLSTSSKAGSISIMPQEITPDTPITEVAEAFLTSGFRQIPVVSGQVIQGMVSRTDLIGIVKNIKELEELKVYDIMTEDVQTIGTDDPVDAAVLSMKNLTIRTLPVVNDRGQLTGIIGIKQVANYNWREKRRETVGEVTGGNSPVEIKVSSIALNSVFTIRSTATLGEAVDEMLKNNISTLPVVDDGDLVGILTKYDIIELLASFRQRDMVYTQITGLDHEDRFAMDEIDNTITQSLHKIAKISRPMLFTLHVTKYHANGGSLKYSLNGRLITEGRIWVASAVDWDLIKATNSLMQRFERRVIEKKEERLAHRKKNRNNI